MKGTEIIRCLAVAHQMRRGVKPNLGPCLVGDSIFQPASDKAMAGQGLYYNGDALASFERRKSPSIQVGSAWMTRVGTRFRMKTIISTILLLACLAQPGWGQSPWAAQDLVARYWYDGNGQVHPGMPPETLVTPLDHGLLIEPGWKQPWTPPKDETFSRSVEYECKTYRVEYTWNPIGFEVPATMPPGQPHYSARIIVWLGDEKVNKNPILGTYVPGGCFEDVPVEWVKKALAQREEPERNSIPSLSEHVTNFISGDIVFGTLMATNVVFPLDPEAIALLIDEELAEAKKRILKRLTTLEEE